MNAIKLAWIAEPQPILFKKYKTMTDFNSLQITSVNDLPGYHAKVAFSMNTAEVFKESGEISPRHLNETLCYMPWGAQMTRCRLISSS